MKTKNEFKQYLSQSIEKNRLEQKHEIEQRITDAIHTALDNLRTQARLNFDNTEVKPHDLLIAEIMREADLTYEYSRYFGLMTIELTNLYEEVE